MINLIIYIVVLLSAIWVYIDCKKYKKAGLTGFPLAWAFLTFLFWLPTFPIYLILKFLKYQRQLQDPNYQPNQLLINLSIIFVVFVFIIVVIYSFRDIFKALGIF